MKLHLKFNLNFRQSFVKEHCLNIAVLFFYMKTKTVESKLKTQ